LRRGDGGRCTRSTAFAGAIVVFAAPVLGASPSLPGAAETIGAFYQVERWVRGWVVSSEPRSIDPARTTAACVTFRLGGRPIGRGTSASGDGQSIWRASRDAYVQAVEALPVEADALRDRRIEEMTPRITIDLQLAGVFTPLIVEDEGTIALQFPLGVEGIAVRVGERTEAVFPGTMLSTGTTPAEAVRVALSRLGLPPKPLAELMSGGSVTIYHFPVRHLVQAREGSAPEFVYRGGRIVPLGDVTGPALRSAAGMIASHILSHAWPGDEPHGMTGDYHPLTDKYDPLLAPPIDQAACAFALLRYAGAPGVTAGEAGRATRFAAKVLGDLAAVAPGEADPLGDPASAAMWVVAWSALPADHALRGSHRDFSERALGVVRGVFNAEAGAWREGAAAGSRGALALALAVGSDGDVSVARAAVRAVFKETEAAALVGQMPWLGWAELAVAGADGEIPAVEALREMRESAGRFTVGESELGSGGLDLVGGMVFTRTSTPLPTWHGLRALAFLATMLGDARLTAGDRVVPELARLRPTLRFLLQLMINDPLMHMHRDRERSVGGVRPAVWDQTAGLEPAAMGLLCVSETLRAMEARAGG
jgi:hypothetical protein